MDNVIQLVRRKRELISNVVAMGLILLAVIVFLGKGNSSKNTIIMSLIVVIIALVHVFLFDKLKNRIHIYAFSFLILFGGLSAVIQPIVDMPDEFVHYARAEIVSEGKFIVYPKDKKHETIKAVENLRDNLGKTYLDSDIVNKKIDYTTVEMEHIASSSLAFVYFPQALGIKLAKIMNLDVIWSLWLARIFNLIVYSLLVAYAIKCIPKWKFAMFFVAALPMSIQQAASCSPDAMVNASVFVLISYFLKLYLKEDEPITTREMIIFTLIGAVSILTKVTNVFFCGLCLLLPIKKENKKTFPYIIKSIMILLFVIIGGGYYLYTTKLPVPDIQKVYLDSVGAGSQEQLHYIITNFKEWILNFGAALINNAFEYCKMLNDFGQLNYSYSFLNLLTLFMFGKIFCEQESIKMPLLHKILVLLMVVGNYSFICLALYMSWTPVGASYIDGIQGRYFIPLLAMLPLLFASLKNQDSDNGISYINSTVLTVMVCMMLLATIMFFY